jgi:hypothetical protein
MASRYLMKGAAGRLRRAAHNACRLASLAAFGLALAAHLAAGGSRSEATRAFAEGNARYEAQEFAAALSAYRAVLAAGYGSAELFLNLGNSAYRIGEPGWAAYYYEQALRRAPSDPDIRSNLALARREALGEEPALQGSPVLDRAVALQSRLTVRGTVTTAVALLWLAAGLIVWTWLWTPSRRTRLLRWGALATALLALALLSLKAAQGSLAAEALIVRPSTAHAEPSAEATVEFRLPAASPVGLGRSAPGWREVIVSSSLRGWVREEDVVSFAAPR